MSRTRRLVIAGMLGILAVLVLSFAIILITVMGPNTDSGTGGAAATPTAAKPTATPMPILHVTAAQGWVATVGLPFAKAVAFSTGHPLDGYTCGNLAQTQAQLPLELSATHDGGRTWQQPIMLPIKGANCEITISPTDSQDLLVAGIACIAVCADGDQTYAYLQDWYRSRDGGATWHPIIMPTGDEQALTGYSILPYFVWVGSTLLMDVTPFSQVGGTILPHYFAKSLNGAPFTWLDTTAWYGALGSGTAQYGFAAPITWGNNILIQYGVAGSPKIPWSATFSSDGGQTWTHFTPQITGIGTLNQPISDIVVAETTLIGTYFDAAQHNAIVVHSTDSGHTWTPLAAQPQLTDFDTLLAVPDGTLYILAGQPPHYSLSILATGASSWQALATLPAGSNIAVQEGARYQGLTVSWDTKGHPIAAWTSVGRYSSAAATLPDSYGLDYHTAAAG